MVNSSYINKQSGVGLIEVMVTVFILSTALLALAALQNRSLQFNQGAYLRSQANIMAYDILDRMRNNRDNVASYVIGEDTDTPSAGGSVANTDLSEWRTGIESYLPNGKGGIACDVNSVCTVTISWDELDSSEDTDEDGIDDTDANTSTFSYSAKI